MLNFVGYWLLRAAFAGFFLYHGVTKFTGGVEGFASAMGLSLPVAYHNTPDKCPLK